MDTGFQHFLLKSALTSTINERERDRIVKEYIFETLDDSASLEKRRADGKKTVKYTSRPAKFCRHDRSSTERGCRFFACQRYTYT